MIKSKKNRGIMLTPLLIFIALVSMIAGTVAVLNRGVFAWDSGESRGQLNAATLKKQAADLKTGFNQAVASGIESGQITLDEGSKGLYNPSAGFAIKQTIPVSACAAASCEWQLINNLKIYDITGSDSVNVTNTEGCVKKGAMYTYYALAQSKESSSSDSILIAAGLNASTCEQLNKSEDTTVVANGTGATVLTTPVEFTPGANGGASTGGGGPGGPGGPGGRPDPWADLNCIIPAGSAALPPGSTGAMLPQEHADAINASQGQALWYPMDTIQDLMHDFSFDVGISPEPFPGEDVITFGFIRDGIYYTVIDTHFDYDSLMLNMYYLIKKSGSQPSLPLRPVFSSSCSQSKSSAFNSYAKVPTGECPVTTVSWGSCYYENHRENNRSVLSSRTVENHNSDYEGTAKLSCGIDSTWTVTEAICNPAPPPPPPPPPAPEAWYGDIGGPFTRPEAVAAAIADVRRHSPGYRDVEQNLWKGSLTENAYTVVIRARVSLSIEWHDYSYHFTKQ